ncbi:MAG: septum formation initiator family protein [Burkholderia sp.]|nr:septum formation initiator family protein [Burkholderia sp.]
MRLFTAILVTLLGVIQWPLWVEYGGLLSVRELQKKLNNKIQSNIRTKIYNDQIMKEVQDLKNGTTEIEEVARYKMKMLKEGEVFIQFDPPSTQNFPSISKFEMPSHKNYVSK